FTKTSSRCQRHRLERMPWTRRLRISPANIGPNRCHQNRTVSWLMSMPRSCSRSSTLLSESGKRMYIITARRMISGDVLKWRNGESRALAGGEPPAGPASSRVLLTPPYLGIRGDLGDGASYDVSLGARELTLGTGMLIANGATSGFDRGALKLGPRKAWEKAAIGHLTFGNVTGTAFYLDPNELPANDGGDELAGIDLRYDDPQGGYLGATYVDVLNSDSPYPQAGAGGGPPSVIPGAREGTRTLNLYGKTNPFAGALKNWTFAADLALQRNDRIDLEAWAGRVTAGYTFADMTWT